MPMLPLQWNNSAAQASLAPVASSPEYYIPLWWWSGNANQGLNGVTSAGTLIDKGAQMGVHASASATSANKLHTLNSAWAANTKYSFEATIYGSGAATTSAALWDITANAIVSGSTISTTSTTATVVRSGQFTLTPGHIYGVTGWISNGSYYVSITDASLIVFPS
jgi:hypothetical protein